MSVECFWLLGEENILVSGVGVGLVEDVLFEVLGCPYLVGHVRHNTIGIGAVKWMILSYGYAEGGITGSLLAILGFLGSRTKSHFRNFVIPRNGVVDYWQQVFHLVDRPAGHIEHNVCLTLCLMCREQIIQPDEFLVHILAFLVLAD